MKNRCPAASAGQRLIKQPPDRQDGPMEDKMLTKTQAVDGAAIKKAIEGRDGKLLASFYTDDALVRVIDRNNPPSKPREIRGRAAITTFWDDICSRAMTHKVDTTIADGNNLAFTQACAYPDGTKVFCAAMLELKNGQIARQTVVQAWDE
ncbi:nuclear transport factor 2 family protein [Mesorhizobium sp. M0909]|uniref:nuclear transport factor 2 family protein n=2 Tax=unclassified Mesorhizobium TaxID=325217 RepID=UPI0033397738